jgi:hypothetical protein
VGIADRTGCNVASVRGGHLAGPQGHSRGHQAEYRSILDSHVNPAIGDRTLGHVANDREIVQDLLTVAMAHLSYSRRKVARQIITDEGPFHSVYLTRRDDRSRHGPRVLSIAGACRSCRWAAPIPAISRG